ncbi:MAG: phosphoadenylyl-sulfate reductase [Anaerolineae bacterium]|nr:phosphoadenylyl-sulfate reductase [Anaerolineae bacterium]
MTVNDAVIHETLERLNAEFENSTPQEILHWAVQNYGQSLVSVTSFQPTGIVILHMLSEIAPNTPVLTLDTGLLFPETYALMEQLEQQLNLNLIRVRPALTVERQAEQYGAALWERDPDRCCDLRKTVPLAQALTPYSAWITGLRRDQSEGRGQTPIISWDRKHEKVKLAPLATWNESMVWMYLEAFELPHNALHDQGYPSIGCYPCTQAVSPDSSDKRAGRWRGHRKTECGIHVINR